MSVVLMEHVLPEVDLSSLQEVSPDLIKLVPEDMVRNYQIFPLSFENNILIIAISDPHNLAVFEDLSFILNCDATGVLAKESQIKALIDKYYKAS